MVRTTPEELEHIRKVIAGVHDAVFADDLDPDDIELSQLRSDDTEMDVYPPRWGVNVRLWRRWGPVKKMEVLLHEMAHVEDPEDNHGPDFWQRLAELVDIAADHWDEVEDAIGADIDVDAVRRKIVDEVHEGVIDGRRDTVRDRRRWLRDRFGLGRRDEE